MWFKFKYDVTTKVKDLLIESLYQFRKMYGHTIRYKLNQKCLKRYHNNDSEETIFHINGSGGGIKGEGFVEIGEEYSREI